MSASTCPRCGTSKDRAHFACSPCWFALPADVRSAIWRAFRRHGPMSEQWFDAAGRAFDAWGMERPGWLAAPADTDRETGEQ